MTEPESIKENAAEWLARRFREVRDKYSLAGGNWDMPIQKCDEVIAELAALRAENERLRQAIDEARGYGREIGDYILETRMRGHLTGQEERDPIFVNPTRRALEGKAEP